MKWQEYKNMLTDIYDIQSYAETLTSHAKTSDGKNIIVKFSSTSAPCTRVTDRAVEITLPKINEHLSERDAALARWYMIHEIAHHTEGPEIFGIMKDNALDPSKSPLGALLNCFEDGRIEKAGASKYAGDANVFSTALNIMLKEGIPQYKEAMKNDEMQRIGACTVAELEARAEWNFGASNNYHDFEALLNGTGRKALKSLREAGIVERLKDLKDGHATLDVAKDAYKIVWEDDPDKHIEEQKKKKEQEDEGEGEGEGKEEGEGKQGKGEGQPQEGKGQPEQGDGKKVNKLEDLGGKVDYLKMLQSKVPKNETGASGSGVKLDYASYMDSGYHGSYDPTPWKDIRVAWFHKDKYSHKNMKGLIEDGHYYIKRIREISQAVHEKHGKPGKGFGNKVRRHLQVLSQSRYVGGHKRGRLHRKNAYKIGVPQVGNGEWNSKVFRQKHQQDILDVAVCVLTDFSGSMISNSKIAHAIDSAMLLNTSIGTSLHIPLQLLTFSEHGNNAFIGVVKDYNERITDEEVEQSMFKSGTFMSGNPDGDAVLWAYKSLLKRKEKRKILIVLSDGSPASSRGGDDMAFVQNVVKEIENGGKVEIVGLGIMDRNVKHIYSKNETISKADELEKAVLNLVKKQIIK